MTGISQFDAIALPVVKLLGAIYFTGIPAFKYVPVSRRILIGARFRWQYAIAPI